MLHFKTGPAHCDDRARAAGNFQRSSALRLRCQPAISAAQLGTKDVVDIKIAVDKTFVPAVITNGASRDPRELGVRVFHAYIQPKAS